MTTAIAFKSKCCGVEAVEDFKDNPRDHHDPIEIYRCNLCHKECEVDEVCDECFGTGEISVDESDGEGHTTRGTGTEKCRCSIKESTEE